MRFFLIKISCLALICFTVPELALRTVLRSAFSGTNRIEDFYLPVEDVAVHGKIDIILVGTSRVAAAVSAETLEEELTDFYGERPVVVNAGKGYSTQALHYLGLKRLFEKYPDQMAGVLVLVEAPSGLPIYQRWNDDWVSEAWPTLYGPLMSSDNLFSFCLNSSNSIQVKLYAIASGLSRTVRYFRYIQPKLEEKFNNKFNERIALKENRELTNAGGIRNDQAGINIIRERIMQQESYGRGPSSSSGWDESTFADIASLVRKCGGHFATFAMPESSYQFNLLPTDYRMNQELIFSEWAESRQFTILRNLEFSWSDNDFPDLLHMSSLRTVEFSQILAKDIQSSSLTNLKRN